jgi:hypothetical protein
MTTRSSTSLSFRTLSLSRDINGNKTLKVTRHDGGRGFSIQTLGNLPKTHRDGITDATADELHAYIKAHGTEGQRKALGIA